MKNPTTKNFIKEIYIEKLFGYFSYKIPKQKLSNEFENLLIIYGDNGTGKTTILELIFYLLSSVNLAGHKSEIAKIKFKEINVKFFDGTEITALREHPTEGSYNYILRKNGNLIFDLFLPADNENSIKLPEDSETNIKLLEMYKYIDNMNISVSLLSDDRKVYYSLAKYYQGGQQEFFRSQFSKSEFERLKAQGILPQKKDQLRIVIDKLEHFIRNQALVGSRQGEKSSNAIYDEIVARITKSRLGKRPSPENIQVLLTELNKLRKMSNEFAKYGLISKVNVEGIGSSLKKAKQEKLQIIYNVIEPYVKGISARLNSLKSVQELILTFTNTINSYFTNKKIAYHLSTGFLIKQEYTQEFIPINNLSSGEKQLLLLLSNVITASDEVNIFIIDEPELSLNVKWQRELLDTLLKFNVNKNIQFIICTHSIELLTKHHNHVHKLINENI